MSFVNLLVRWPWNFGYFCSIILRTVCALFPNAGELGSSYSLIIVSLIVFSNDFLIVFFMTTLAGGFLVINYHDAGRKDFKK